ncbi:hypothetical protein ACWGJB_39940 [Streptomyces sp. NPDC054813]
MTKAFELAKTNLSAAVALLNVVHSTGGAPAGPVALPDAPDQAPDDAAISPP